MSLSQKKPSISIPEYKAPEPTSFSGYGVTAGRNGNTYSINEDPTQLADRKAAEQVRRELIGTLGLSGSQSDPYAQTLLQENLRLSQPQLENSLIQRGLGGSTVYQGALTDLINKATTDAILNSQNQKLNTLQGLQSSYLGPYQQLGQNLLGLSSGYDADQQRLAQQMYQALLPYTAQVNYPKQSGLAGLISGLGTGFMSGDIPGALEGGASGYFNSAVPAYSEPYMLSSYNNRSSLTLQDLLGLTRGF